MKSKLEACRILAERLDGVHGGMASVHVLWHPYECVWKAKANWSDGTEVVFDSETPDGALDLLAIKLCELKQANS